MHPFQNNILCDNKNEVCTKIGDSRSTNLIG